MKAFNCLAAAALIGSSLPAAALAQDAPFFGTDESQFANDGECDDARFTGEGMAEVVMTDSIARDATDCSAAFAAGNLEPNPLFAEPAQPGQYDYGDDASDYANDGECDDIRFTGNYASETIYLYEDIAHDASDCRSAVEEGRARWQANARDFEYGQIVTDDDAEDAEI